jgi:3-phosphoshikimate 1-carboxyvinyltransferase
VEPRAIQPLEKPVSATLRIAPSKSVTHRALVAAAMASGRSAIVGPLDADDTRTTAEGLANLGFRLEMRDGCWELEGLGGRVPGGGTVTLRESGTSFRFLTAVASLGETPSRLDGSPRLRQRPVEELAGALSSLGARISLTAGSGGLPLEAGGGPVRGGRVVVPAGRSSQFASAMLLIGSSLPGGLEIELTPPAVSLPYIDLTVRVLEEFGVRVERPDELRWRVPEHGYPGRDYRVEGDHSSASYFLAAAAVLGGRVRAEGLDPDSAQADARLQRILPDLGCEVRSGPGWVEVEGTGTIRPFDLDMSDAPDLVPTLAVLALFADGPSAMRGIGHLRIKESDRLETLAGNLRRLGRDASTTEDALLVGAYTSRKPEETTIETASDHRMAMAFAIAGLRLPGVTIDDAGCVAKSNPGFWQDLYRLTTGS